MWGSMLPRAFLCLTAIALTTSYAVPYGSFDSKSHARPEFSFSISDPLSLPRTASASSLFGSYLAQASTLASDIAAYGNLRARYIRSFPSRSDPIAHTIYWEGAFWDPWDLFLIMGAPILFFGTLLFEALRLSRRHYSNEQPFRLRY